MYRVIVVEDVEQIRKGFIFSTPWEELDCVVVGEAANGKEGLESLHALQPDILITDVKMPVMDGLDMLEAYPPGTGYEALVLTGFDEFHLAKRALRLGVLDYLLKPVDSDELEAAIQLCKSRLNAWHSNQRERDELEMMRMARGFLEKRLDVSREHSSIVLETLDYIHQNFADRILLRDLADKLAVSSGYLNTQFKNEVGTTFNDYLNRYRMQKAVQYLTEGGSKVYVVAEKVGIPDYKYFVKVFKKYVGHSPHDFILRWR